MHLHFIFPRWQKLLEDRPELKQLVSGYDIGAFRMVGLGLSTAAGAVPAQHQITLLDQNIAEIDYSITPDLVCLGFFTPQATNAYAIAEKFRRRGVKVIAGGIHPTMTPDETSQHFDAVVTGPVEGLWEEILSDLKAGELKPLYRGNKQTNFAQARRDLFANSDYLKAGVIQTSRGCTVNCPFCVVPTCYGNAITFRPIADVIHDIDSLPFPCFFFADENLLFPDRKQKEYTRDLLRQMINMKNRRISFVASYPNFIKSVDQYDWFQFSKARLRQVYLVLGLMQPLSIELVDTELHQAIQWMKKHEIEVLASFTIGNPCEAANIEPLIDLFCEQTETNLAEFTLYTPFPGTPVFRQLKQQNRILTEQWERYNGANVVFKPLNQTPQELEELYLRMWQRFYSGISESNIYNNYVKGFGGSILRNRSRGTAIS